MNPQGSPLPDAPSLDEYRPALVRMAAATILLPHPTVVKAVGRAVFPTIRKAARRTEVIVEEGVEVGMYDDNYTPTVALLWSHGLSASNRAGWGFAHVWPASDDRHAYTHLANLALIPESFGSLTDKNGPLTDYLRWHAWSVYGWKPASAETPLQPADFDGFQWRYLPEFGEPLEFIRARINEADNARMRTLRPIMQRLGML